MLTFLKTGRRKTDFENNNMQCLSTQVLPKILCQLSKHEPIPKTPPFFLPSFAVGAIAACSSLGLAGVGREQNDQMKSILGQLRINYISSLHGSGGDFQVLLSSSAIFHSESRFNLKNFFSPLGPRGVEFSGPIWSPARLFVNLANWAFVAAVPALYGAIYKFRKAHVCTTIGTNSHHQLLFFVTNPHITLQVQEHGKRPLDEGTPTLIELCF